MTGTIIVDAETLCDKMLSFWGLEKMKISTRGFGLCFSIVFRLPVLWSKWGLPRFGCDPDGLNEYTVFLPNTAAIESLQELLNLNQFDLLNFTEGMVAGLSYHIVPGVYLAEELQDGAFLPTVEGQSVSISIGASGTMLNDANIIHTDIVAFNGVIHVIDEVLVPSGYPGATTWDVIVRLDHTILERALLAENLNQHSVANLY